MATRYSRVACSFLLLLCLATAERTVLVNESDGIDAPKCLHYLADEQNHTACKSLQFVATNIGENCSGLTIFIESNLFMEGIVSFNNCLSLTITSEVGSVISSKDAGTQCGLSFLNITNLTLSDITVTHCEYDLAAINRSVAVHLVQTTNVLMRSFEVSHTSGTGLVVSNVEGSVVIEKSNFTNNSVSNGNVSTDNVFAGGIHMWFSKALQADIVVKDSTFQWNLQPYMIPTNPTYHSHDIETLDGHGTGGAIGILFAEDSRGVSISLEGCTFNDNRAFYGAGLYIHFRDNSTDNSLSVANSFFSNNHANAGGGMCMGADTAFNRISVSNTTFSGNRARYGGGTTMFGIYSTGVTQNKTEIVLFINCTWENNTAYYSSAVDLYHHLNSGFLPVPVFSDCRFTGNTLKHNKDSTKYRNSGVFVATNFEVRFKGCNHFVGNRYTALQLVSATMILEKGTTMMFDGNVGTKGGAIALYGYSSLRGNDDCSLVFYNNSADKVGGGIYYQPFDQREIIGGHSCFIQYIGDNKNSTDRNYTFTFSNNSAAFGGTSVFAVSFYPCFFHYYGTLIDNNLSSFFSNIGTFHFDRDLDDSPASLATEGNLFMLEQPSKTQLWTAPGEVLYIPMSVMDEFNHTTQTPINLEVHPDRKFYYFTHNRTRIYGQPTSVKKLIFDTQNTRDAYFDEISVELTDCPPGYYFDEAKNTCLCSAGSEYHEYHGITKCNSSKFRAYITREYWAGYHDNSLFTSPCAFQLCQINSDTAHHHLLPASRDDMNHLMCGDSKEGILCGTCSAENSAYFHSNTHKCGPEDWCDYGILFYLLSEVVPTIVVFTLIIYFDIGFTSGGVTGLIFFSQMVLNTPTDMEKILHGYDNATIEVFRNIQFGYILVYNILNLSFFSIDKFSFCLWHSANPMDVLVFSYVTTSIALVLVWVIVRIMNSKWYVRKNRKSKPRSVVHGLSAFLVLSFSQCTQVSINILGQNVIRSNNAVDRTQAVTHHGGFLYFGSAHLPYAVIAIVVLVCIGIIPLVLLLLFPLLLHALSLCKLSEHHITRAVLKAVQIHRLTPLFDSFQSCYKDKLRFFAGLYFFYKLCIQFCCSYSNNLIQLMAVLEAIIFIILGVHATVQPYKERSHNVIDSCLFFNLGFINGINIYTNYIAIYHDFRAREDIVVVLCTLQMVLIYLPIVGVLCWCIRKMVKKRLRQQYQVLESFPNDTQEEREESGEPSS